MSHTALRVAQVSKRFGETVALDQVSLDVDAGEIVAIIGPSGSGKSTLIRCVHMLETYDSGSVWLEGEQLGYQLRGDRLHQRSAREVARQRGRMGMVFQQFNLFPHFSVLENICDAPVQVAGRPRRVVREEATRLLDLVGLADKATAFPRQLSGGQQQRVAIARALAMKPDLLLFDEPTSALDPETVGEVLRVMRDVAATGTTMIVVTHEIRFARDIADRIVFMEGGRIVESGSPSQVLDAPSPRLADFLRATASAS